jgi:hypothetical protein
MIGQVAVTAWYFANRPPYIDPPGHGETASIAVASSNSRAAGPHGHSPRATDDSAIYIDVGRKSRVQGSQRLSLVRCLSPRRWIRRLLFTVQAAAVRIDQARYSGGALPIRDQEFVRQVLPW